MNVCEAMVRCQSFRAESTAYFMAMWKPKCTQLWISLIMKKFGWV